MFPPSPLEEGLSSLFPPPCLPGGGCPGSSGSHWGDGSVSPSGGVLCPGVGSGVALPSSVGGFGCGWGSGGGVGCHGGSGGSTGPGGNGIALTSIWPWSVPNGVGSPSGLKGDVSPSKGSVLPVLGGGIGPGVVPCVGSCSPSVELHLGSSSAESHLAPPAVESGPDLPSVEARPVHPTQWPFSSSSWASLAWDLSWVLGSSPALPSWISSRVAVPWIHPLLHQVLVLGTSLVTPLGLQVCLDPPPALWLHPG